MIQTLYLSHQLFDWNQVNISDAKFLSRSAMLSALKNSATQGNFYTCLEDLELKIHEIDQLINCCQTINIVGITENLFEEIKPESIPIYLKFLNVLSRYPDKCTDTKKYHGAINKELAQHYSQRASESATLWVGGCSISAGDYVNPNEKYAELLANKLDLPLTLLARGGSSISWQADQWLRADIRPGDTVVWGLTNVTRLNYVDHGEWRNITIKTYLDLPKQLQYWNLDYFDSPTQAFPYLKNILQVENFCKKLGVDYYFVNLMDQSYIPFVFQDHPRFLDLAQFSVDGQGGLQFKDYGSDGQHPGPAQHQDYAEDIYKFIQQLAHA